MPIMRRQCDKLLSVGDYVYAAMRAFLFLISFFFPEKKNDDMQVFDVENMQLLFLISFSAGALYVLHSRTPFSGHEL
jgi:hypothetical protein